MRSFAIGVALWAVFGNSAAPAFAPDSLRSLVMDIWHQRILENQGVSSWNAENDARRVFQEWTTLMERARRASERERGRVGRLLEEYVVDGNLHALSEMGTTVPLPWRREADFDMALLGVTSLIGLYQHDTLLLTHKTLLHLIKHVTRCWGQEPKHYFEVLNLNFQETENHVFMIESTRYLTNQFIWENPRGIPGLDAFRDSLQMRGVILNNERGRLRSLLLKQMQEILKRGLFEFNARVYQRFTLHALNNLYTFSSDSLVSRGAASVLDYIATKFAFQSFESFRLGPYRRNAEHYRLEEPWTGDFACSFFVVQSGEHPWSSLEDLARHWKKSPAHSSTGLYSALLAYRVPPPILGYLQNPRGSYWSRMETKHRVNRKLESSPEQYFKSRHFLLSMGGSYKFYQGANFPIEYSFMMGESPWVYDIIAQSSNAFVSPKNNIPGGQVPRFITFKGDHWKHKNLGMYRNFIYAYAPSPGYRDGDWPQEIPRHLMISRDTLFSRGAFDFRVMDLRSQGLYLILSRLHHRKTFLRHHYQKYNRGTIEMVDTAWTAGWESLVRRIASFPREDAEKYHYPLWNGEVARLNPKYTPETKGILSVEIPEEGGGFQRIYPDREPRLLLEAQEWFPDSPHSGSPVAKADGKGRLWVKSPDGKGKLEVDFQAWWHPRRSIR